MQVDAITVSINFGDYLETTLPRNRKVFRHMLVVTAKDDVHTMDVCIRNGVRYITTNDHCRGNDVFNKGKAINAGLQLLTRNAWMCHLDADCVVTTELRRCLRDEYLKRNTIYGCHRLLCHAPGHYRKWELNRCPVHLGQDLRLPGQAPAGFFQLWHGEQQHLYPENHPSATKSDLDFARLFPRRRILPAFVVHICSEKKNEENRDHLGRVSPEWTP